MTGWHLPTMLLCRWSGARCARVSYNRFGGSRGWEHDEQTFSTLIPPIGADGRPTKPIHASPVEHQAKLVVPGSVMVGSGGNLGVWWAQYRKSLPGEYHPHFETDAAILASWNIPEELFEPLT